jgi:dipeptidase E
MGPVRLLLLSNSTNPGEPYLGWPEAHLRDFLRGARRVFFVPFAGVRISWDEYAEKVRERFAAAGAETVSAHQAKSPMDALAEADAVAVGGGNTFHLLKHLRESGLLGAIAGRVGAGMPYVGWSAGSNVACPTIRTTNDMPVVEPGSLSALDLVPFQINPHYTDATLAGHGGETREERILEFLEVNQGTVVVGLRESSLLRREGTSLLLQGNRGARIFRKGSEPEEVPPGASLDGLLG